MKMAGKKLLSQFFLYFEEGIYMSFICLAPDYDRLLSTSIYCYFFAVMREEAAMLAVKKKKIVAVVHL